jgi:copper chaperone CopZ
MYGRINIVLRSLQRVEGQVSQIYQLKKFAMKLFILIASVVLLSTTAAKSQITRAELTATGLTCSMCSKATYKQLTSIPEVKEVVPDLNTTAFMIYFKDGSAINVSELKKKVEDAGFSVGELVVVFNFNNQQAVNNSSFKKNNITYTFMDTKPGVLSGEVKVKILDKGFVVDKEYKKLAKLTKQYPSYATVSNNSYHIKTL